MLCRAVLNCHLGHLECNELVGYIIGVSSFLTNSNNYLVAVFAKYRTRQTKVRIKAGLYINWCGVNRLGDSGVHTLGDTSAFFVNLAGQLLLTRRGKTRMEGVGIVFEFYIAPL